MEAACPAVDNPSATTAPSSPEMRITEDPTIQPRMIAREIERSFKTRLAMGPASYGQFRAFAGR
jgi:hypothetical protein